MPNQALHSHRMTRADAAHFEGEGNRWRQKGGEGGVLNALLPKEHQRPLSCYLVF